MLGRRRVGLAPLLERVHRLASVEVRLSSGAAWLDAVSERVSYDSGAVSRALAGVWRSAASSPSRGACTCRCSSTLRGAVASGRAVPVIALLDVVRSFVSPPSVTCFPLCQIPQRGAAAKFMLARRRRAVGPGRTACLDEVEPLAVALELAPSEPVRHARERRPQVPQNQSGLQTLVSEECSLGHPSPEGDGVGMRIIAR